MGHYQYIISYCMRVIVSLPEGNLVGHLSSAEDSIVMSFSSDVRAGKQDRLTQSVHETKNCHQPLHCSIPKSWYVYSYHQNLFLSWSQKEKTAAGWWFGPLFHILGISSSQLTIITIFQKGLVETTNQPDSCISL